MSSTTSTTPKSGESGAEVEKAGVEKAGKADTAPAKTGPLASDRGSITIDDAVVTKVAGLAAREVSGVHAMGAGTARAFGAIKQRIPGSSASTTVSQGVSVEVGETEAAIDLDIVVEYGVSVADLGRAIQDNVKLSVERITGLKVVEVNVNVDDVYLGGGGDDEPAEARVQ